jgi:mutator protein MutT
VTSGIPRVVVTAAVIEHGGRFLVTQRPRGVHLAGFWEFPGGKCDDGEPLVRCLEREILEELGTSCVVGHEILAVAHAYPDRVVELHFFACTLSGEPRARLNQEMRWIPRTELPSLEFPPADAELIEKLTNRG